MIVRCIPCESRTSSGSHETEKPGPCGRAFSFLWVCLRRCPTFGTTTSRYSFIRAVAHYISVGSLRRRLTCPHPFDAHNVKPHSGGRRQSRTSSGTTEGHWPEPK